MRGITPHTYLSLRFYANSILYSYARTQAPKEEIKDEIKGIQGHAPPLL